MITTIHVLNSEGDIKVTWDHTSPEEVEKARAEILALKDAGFTFFLIDGTPADEVAAGQGALNARRIEVEELLSAAAPEQDPQPSDPAAVATAPPKRGRPKSSPAASVERVAVAVPRQRGG